MKLIYSNISGIYVFDEKYDLVDKKLFSEKDFISKNLALKTGEWIIEEEKMIDKYSKDKLTFLGFKTKKKEGITICQDITKLRRIVLKDDSWKLNYELSAFELNQSFKQDILIIQAVRTYDDLDKVFNTIAMRIRDWYDFYMPEISRQIDDNTVFIEKILNKERQEKTVGFIKEKQDIELIESLAMTEESLIRKKKEIEKYIENIMKQECPNLLGVAGALLGARLISLAGSIEELAKMPYTTLQLLGAEKALFRHLRANKKSPKHGIIIVHPLIAGSKNKGKAARSLAEILCIASRRDFFKGGDMSAQLNESLKRKMKNETK